MSCLPGKDNLCQAGAFHNYKCGPGYSGRHGEVEVAEIIGAALQALLEALSGSRWGRLLLGIFLTGMALFLIYVLMPTPVEAHVPAMITAVVGLVVTLYWQQGIRRRK